MLHVSDRETALRNASIQPAALPLEAVRCDGKFFSAGDKKIYLRGVTYGTFRADAETGEFPGRDLVAFAARCWWLPRKAPQPQGRARDGDRVLDSMLANLGMEVT